MLKHPSFVLVRFAVCSQFYPFQSPHNLSTRTIIIMDDLVITPSHKAQLHEVADLMLEIYRTLARMGYLDPSWIREGPHDTSVLLPMYHSHGLDATVIYLYSILPYVDTGGAENVDFFQGGEFADFRLEESVERGRDPFYEGEDEVALRPWMTPLSLLGNHQSVIIYDAKKHCIGIFDQESGGSTDHNLWTVVQETSEGGEGAGEEKEEAGEDGENSQDGEEGEDEEDEDEDGDEDEDEDMEEDEDEEGGEGPYDEMDSRPAANVLRDIIRWYHELIETPGGGQHSGGEWDAELVKPLYRKHGWPHDNFDGDAFLVDQARAAAAASAKWSAEEPLHEVAKYRGWLEDDDSPAMRQRRDRLAAAQTVDEECVARWELWQAEQRNRHVRKKLHEAEEVRDRKCPNGQCQKPEDLPLWELRQLRMDSWEKQRTLEAT